MSRARLKCDGTRAETKFGLSAKRTSPFKSAGGGQFIRLLAAEVCASALVMLDTPCSEVVWRVLATHSIRQFPLHFPSSASPCAITFQLDSTVLWRREGEKEREIERERERQNLRTYHALEMLHQFRKRKAFNTWAAFNNLIVSDQVLKHKDRRSEVEEGRYMTENLFLTR